ncbi:MAG: DNA-directed RNA polymerase subunit delta [Erysipelotrichaceae bacterium]|nr:DNA-directed RNA polymerase subunit delta [Erysipelotrichaceae bacterium]
MKVPLSMSDLAFEILTKKQDKVSFNQLWQTVSDKMGFTPSQTQNKIASFYSELMLDNRFTMLRDNFWDLRSRHTYDETHVDTSSLLVDDEESEEELVKDLEEDEDYNEDEDEF